MAPLVLAGVGLVEKKMRQFILLAFLTVFLPSTGESKETIIDLSNRPTFAEIQKSGLPLRQDKVLGTTFDVPSASFSLKLAHTNLAFENARVLFYFPSQKPRIPHGGPVMPEPDDELGWLTVVVHESADAAASLVLKHLGALGFESEDVEAWFQHKMWRTTPYFKKVYKGKDPQIHLQLSKSDKKEVWVTLHIDWVNKAQPTDRPDNQ
jgi:hypothetical protein